MGKLFEKIYDIESNQSKLIQRPYGMIETLNGRFHSIHLRPFPKMISVAEASWLGGLQHKRNQNDRVQLYYNQPVGHRNFLAIKYIVSTLGTTLATLRQAVYVMDEIAKLKQTDAAVCEVTNRRMSGRAMKYFGFEPHLPNSRKRHFIRRYYGQYPCRTQIAGIFQDAPGSERPVKMLAE